MDKKVYIVEYIDEFEPSEINLMVCESLEEAKDILKEIVDQVCTDLEYNNGENMDDWKDTNGRSKEECIEKGKFYVDDLFYAEIIEVEPNELVKISAR